MATEKTYNVGIIGYGLSAKIFQLPFIKSIPSLKLHAIVQRSPKPGNSAKEDYPDAKVYSSADDLFADPETDIIVVGTTPETHYPFTKSALEAGKHVLVEKPFVPTVKEAEELMAISQKMGKMVCVYQNRRWDTDFLTVKDLLAKGTLGKVYEFHSHFDRYKAEASTNWKAHLTMEQGGGMLYDIGSHLIDQTVQVFGMPNGVMSFLANQRDDGHPEPDSITVVLKYTTGPHAGLLATIKAGVLSVEKQQPRYWIRGQKGTYKKYNLDRQEDNLKAGMTPRDPGFANDPSTSILTTLDSDGKPKEEAYQHVEPTSYLGIFNGFVDALNKNDPEAVPVKISEARDVLRIIEAAKESAKTDQMVFL